MKNIRAIGDRNSLREPRSTRRVFLSARPEQQKIALYKSDNRILGNSLFVCRNGNNDIGYIAYRVNGNDISIENFIMLPGHMNHIELKRLLIDGIRELYDMMNKYEIHKLVFPYVISKPFERILIRLGGCVEQRSHKSVRIEWQRKDIEALLEKYPVPQRSDISLIQSIRKWSFRLRSPKAPAQG